MAGRMNRDKRIAIMAAGAGGLAMATAAAVAGPAISHAEREAAKAEATREKYPPGDAETRQVRRARERKARKAARGEP